MYNSYNLDLISFLVDFGLVVLIWIIQLIIYPSFLYYKKENLITWHQKYTNKIALIVIPLMLMQLTIAFVNIYFKFNAINTISLCVVLFLWVFTFTSFAPLHFRISETKAGRNMLLLLVKRNWIRTVLWSVLFLFHYFIK